jgi:hypothetical protein
MYIYIYVYTYVYIYIHHIGHQQVKGVQKNSFMPLLSVSLNVDTHISIVYTILCIHLHVYMDIYTYICVYIYITNFYIISKVKQICKNK